MDAYLPNTTDMKNTIIFLAFSLVALFACNEQNKKNVTVKKVKQQPQRQQPKTVTYQLANTKQWLLTNKDSLMRESKNAQVTAITQTNLFE